MRIVGVDPGATGALALLIHRKLHSVHDMPVLRVRRGKTDKAEVDGHALTRLLSDLSPDVLFLELVGGITGQSASAAFNFGRASGAVEYAAIALGVRVDKIAPATWKRALGLRGGKDDARAMAIRLWGDQATRFARVKDDGRAEAALIAEWGRRNLGGQDAGIFA